MADDLLITRAASHSTGVPGRCLNAARSNHFVIDEPAYLGGPGEAPSPAETFLAGVSSCGVLLVEKFAREEGVPTRAIACRIEGVRTKDKPADFREVRVRFEIAGCDAAKASHLVERYKSR